MGVKQPHFITVAADYQQADNHKQCSLKDIS